LKKKKKRRTKRRMKRKERKEKERQKKWERRRELHSVFFNTSLGCNLPFCPPNIHDGKCPLV
jgi:hypothetical protein